MPSRTRINVSFRPGDEVVPRMVIVVVPGRKEQRPLLRYYGCCLRAAVVRTMLHVYVTHILFCRRANGRTPLTGCERRFHLRNERVVSSPVFECSDEDCASAPS